MCFRLVFSEWSVSFVLLLAMYFFSGLDCFWSGTLTVGRYRETASRPILQIILSSGPLLLLSCSHVSEIRIRCAFGVCDFVATQKG